LIVAVGAALRLGYFLNGDPFVDEWVTMLAARSITERGLPILPSGTLYGHAMLFSYLDALFLATLGWKPVVAQLPSLLAGLLAIPLTYWTGRRLFGTTGGFPAQEGNAGDWWRAEAIGLLGAALLALDPIAILWAGRARAYTLQQVFVLLAILWLFRRQYLLFTLAFVAAVFSHAEAALLLPGFVLGLLLLEGWSIVRQPRVWLSMAISGVAVLARYQVHRLISTEAGRQATEVATRPAIEPFVDIAAGLEPLLPYFTEPYRLAVTVLFLVGLAFAARVWQRRRESGYLLLYPLSLLTLASMLTFVGQTWRDPRYLFMLLPAMFLLAAATAVDLWQLLASRLAAPTWLKAVAAGGLALILLIPPLPEALDTTGKLEEGYGPTLAYVRTHWQPGDQVAGWAVPAIATELGQIDYFAIQIRHEEFLMEKDGVWVDRWVGAPLLDSVEQLQAALDEPGRLWFLTDEFRFRARYTPEFAQAIWDRMDPVFRYHYALAFLERPPAQPEVQRDLQVSFEDGLDLLGYGLDPATLQPGGTLTVTLHWQARDWVGVPYTTFVHLLDPNGQRVDQADGPPFDGLHPTDHWLPGERLHDQRLLTVPDDAIPGRYQLVVGWYDSLTKDRLRLVGGGDSLSLASIPLGEIQVDEPGVLVNVALEDTVELVGFDLWRATDGQWSPLSADEPLMPADRMKARLVWRALAEMDHDYTAFVHLEGPGGVVWGQHDGQPTGGSYPTSHWRPGDLVADEHEFTVLVEADGLAHVSAGMYRLETMELLGQPIILREVPVGVGSDTEATP
jgi:4-amino-4-deoxy-L-arabinose transferase-like glycosyltransferase